MANLGEVAAELASVVHTMNDARLAAVDAMRDALRALSIVEHTTRGSHRRLVRDTLVAWSNAAKNIERTAADISAGNSTVLDYLRDIGVGSGTSMTVGEHAPAPTGTQLVADASDSGTRWHRTRQQVERNIGDVGEVTGKAVRVISELTGPTDGCGHRLTGATVHRQKGQRHPHGQHHHGCRVGCGRGGQGGGGRHREGQEDSQRTSCR